MRFLKSYSILAFLLITSVLQAAAQGSPVETDAIYLKQLENFQRGMTRWKLRNFVPLVGLHKLSPGSNTFGKASDNLIVVNSENAPDHIGEIVWEGGSLIFKAHEGVEPRLEGETVVQVKYTFDEDRNSEKLRERFITWYVQRVGADYWLRIMDDESPLVRAYSPQPYFQANPEMIFEATYKPFKKPKKVLLNNVIGTQQEHNITGLLTFNYKQKKYVLQVINGYLIMFTDETNGTETFHLGRYVRVQIEKGKPVILDFNYAFSPPRSASQFTTCDIPPKDNALPFPVKAGEMYLISDF